MTSRDVLRVTFGTHPAYASRATLDKFAKDMQLALFSEPRARHDDPSTSRVAAESVKASHAHRLETIAAIVKAAGPWGCTADEVWQQACINDEAALKRRSTWHGAVSRAAEAGLIHPRNDGARRLSVLNVVMTVYVTEENQRG